MRAACGALLGWAGPTDASVAGKGMLCIYMAVFWEEGWLPGRAVAFRTDKAESKRRAALLLSHPMLSEICCSCVPVMCISVGLPEEVLVL